MQFKDGRNVRKDTRGLPKNLSGSQTPDTNLMPYIMELILASADSSPGTHPVVNEDISLHIYIFHKNS